jgi:hypothetical protein
MGIDRTYPESTNIWTMNDSYEQKNPTCYSVKYKISTKKEKNSLAESIKWA